MQYWDASMSEAPQSKGSTCCYFKSLEHSNQPERSWVIADQSIAARHLKKFALCYVPARSESGSQFEGLESLKKAQAGPDGRLHIDQLRKKL